MVKLSYDGSLSFFISERSWYPIVAIDANITNVQNKSNSPNIFPPNFSFIEQVLLVWHLYKHNCEMFINIVKNKKDAHIR